MKELLEHLERVIGKRSPTAAELLQPGLPQEHIREMLADGGVRGKIDPIVSLFGWRNGSRLDPAVTLEQASLFPQSIYMFMDLRTMIEHFHGFSDGFIYHPKHDEVNGRYFPVFWDNSTGYLAVDLRSAKQPVVLLDPESEDLANKAYDSFEKFLKDAIHANEENDNLRCFQIR